MASGSAGMHALTGLGAIVLGILAIAGTGADDMFLVLVALLALGATLDLHRVWQAGMLGLALGMFVVAVSGAALLLADRITGGTGAAGLAAALVVHVRKNRKVGTLVERTLNPAQNQRAERVCDVKHHDSNGVVASGVQKMRIRLGAIVQPFRSLLDAILGGRRNVAREWRIVEHNRDRRDRDAARLRHVPQRDG